MNTVKCPHCKTHFCSRRRLNICPVCGHALQESTPSFELTWAAIEEEEFNKKPSRNKYESARSWYAKAEEGNPDAAVDYVAFLKRHEKYALQENQNEEQKKKLYQHMHSHLMEGVQRHSALCAYTILEQPECDEQLREELLRAVCTCSESCPEDLMFSLLKASLSGNYRQARYCFRQQLGLEESESFVMDTKDEARLLAGLAPDLKERKAQMAKAVEQKDVLFLIDCLCRPLADESRAFDHLYHLDRKILLCLEESEPLWLAYLGAELQADANLRGIHMFIKTIYDSQFFDCHDLDALLSLQYEKAYLRPYAEIEKTDWNWI